MGSELNLMRQVSPEVQRLMKAGAKVLEVRDVAEANAIESGKEYYVDRFSDTRNAYILMRRERR